MDKENKLVLNALRKYKAQGYLFHGSPVNDLELIEPKQASDADTSNLFNNDTAVFASNNFVMSLVFGLLDFNRLPMFSEITCSVKKDERSEIIACLPKIWRPHIESASGNIYILDKANFTETDGLQWKSRLPVKPHTCFKISIKEFYTAGGIVEWLS